ncbi:methyltransferase domain-containing protein [Kocuria sp. LUK]|uniref:methyltransferase domain-containing protein n=1 Tax=Kocuria sp. LUK TaxID=2897828 RepID=UPI001E5AFC58|nr:methyltransferase domain-containing protein [Kocuria sp. LUK]MCD1144715.1 methyltransferase domain-containing protein [Kocuria sp. LUK]
MSTRRARPDFSRRDAELAELMDDPACDLAALHRTYARFGLVNRLVAGWARTWRRTLLPLAAREGRLSVLDVGCGGGDLARALTAWAARDGVSLRVTGADPDERAQDWAERATARWAAGRPRLAPPSFRAVTSAQLVEASERFDVVVSNHLLHHLDPPALRALLADSERLARRLVVHNDLVRSAAAHRLWSVGVLPLAPGSFLRTDGMRSLRRAYSPAELAGLAGPGWTVAPGSYAHQQLVRTRSPAGHADPAP